MPRPWSGIVIVVRAPGPMIVMREVIGLTVDRHVLSGGGGAGVGVGPLAHFHAMEVSARRVGKPVQGRKAGLSEQGEGEQ